MVKQQTRNEQTTTGNTCIILVYNILMPILEVKNLSVFSDKTPIVENVSFAVNQGETLAIIGPNGSGKTTLLRSLIGAIPHEGEVHMAKGATIGYVPQTIDLDRRLPATAEEFLSLHGSHRVPKEYSAEDAFALVGLPLSVRKKNMGKLSAGELQRLLIAFALVDYPMLLLFDEPTSNIDMKGQKTIYELLHRLQQTHHFGMILISHDLTVVYQYAHNVLCLNHQQVCFGQPKEVLTPEGLADLYSTEQKFYQHTT